ncbi:MAG: ATP-binding protein [Bacillota bacterium]
MLSQYFEPYTERLRDYYWTGHFFFLLICLAALMASANLDMFWFYHRSLPAVLVVGTSLVAAGIFLQRRFIDVSFEYPRPLRTPDFMYLLASVAMVCVVVCVTGGAKSVFKTLLLLPVIVCALNCGKKLGLFTAVAAGTTATALTLLAEPVSSLAVGADLVNLLLFVLVGWLIGEISELNKQLAHNLLDDKIFLQNVLDRLPLGVLTVSGNETVVYLNRSAKEFYGFTLLKKATELPLIGRNWALIKSARKKGGALSSHLRGQVDRVDGSVAHVAVTAHPLRLENDDQALLLVLQDVSREKELEVLRRQLGRILEMVDLAIICADSHGRITLFNHAAERIFGIASFHALGKTESEVFRQAGLPGDRNHPLFRTETRNAEITLNGRYLLVQRSTARLISGEDVRTITIITDYTEKKRMEEEANRMATLTAIGEMAAGMAHEIRNPLTSIRGFAQLIYEKDETVGIGEVKPYLDIMLAEVKHVENLIANFLLLTQPGPPSWEKVNLNALIGEIRNLITAEATRRSIETTFHTEPDLPAVEGNGEQLKQVVLNLVANALDAAGTGGRVSLSTYGGGDNVYLEVVDNGPGVPSGLEYHIFVPFFSTKDRGSGLGLAVSHRIVTEHGGVIELASSPGHTVFRVRLPRAGCHPKSLPSFRKTGHHPAVGPRDGKAPS